MVFNELGSIYEDPLLWLLDLKSKKTIKLFYHGHLEVIMYTS